MKAKLHRLIGPSDVKGMLRNFGHLSRNWKGLDDNDKKTDENYLLMEETQLNQYSRQADANSVPIADAALLKSFNMGCVFDESDPECWEIVDTPFEEDIDESSFLYYAVPLEEDADEPQTEILYVAIVHGSNKSVKKLLEKQTWTKHEVL